MRGIEEAYRRLHDWGHAHPLECGAYRGTGRRDAAAPRRRYFAANRCLAAENAS
ncbi:hypothetical protein KCP76_19080 [Salmonella enterica subsp. enterica serovar Weltevreden]|nr:hypothetical protein KCP76_19080 [Salmonella enterica subsp. enterica serovar Weltevreden]